MVFNPFSSNRFWSLNWHSKSSVPNERRKNSQSSRHTKHDSVVVIFIESIVFQEDTRMSIHIRPRILGFSVFGEDSRNNFVDCSDKFEERIIRKMFESELTLSGVSWISLSQNSVSESWDDSSRFESRPAEINQLLFSDFCRISSEMTNNI